MLTASPLKCVYVFTSRFSLFPDDWRGTKGNGRENYAWFVWEHGYQGSPVIHLLHPDVCGESEEEGERPPRPLHPPLRAGS